MGARFSGCSIAGVLVAVATATPAAAIPNAQCTLTTPVHEVQSLTQLPPELVALLPPLADVGAPFNKTDSVTDPTLPFRRLIRAGNRDTDWFVWYEHGGVGYFWEAVLARVVPGGEATVLANAGTITDTLCQITDAAFAGHVPPYPPGAWGASGF